MISKRIIQYTNILPKLPNTNKEIILSHYFEFDLNNRLIDNISFYGINDDNNIIYAYESDQPPQYCNLIIYVQLTDNIYYCYRYHDNIQYEILELVSFNGQIMHIHVDIPWKIARNGRKEIKHIFQTQRNMHNEIIDQIEDAFFKKLKAVRLIIKSYKLLFSLTGVVT